MNILIFSWRDPKHPFAGGAEQVMHEHAKGWIKQGFNVTLFSSYFKGAPRKEDIDGVTVVRFGYQLLGVHIAAFFWYLFGTKEKFDLVIDQFHGLPFFTPFYVRVKKLAVLQEVAREVWLMNHLPKPLNWIVGWLGYLLEQFFFIPYRNIPFMTGSNSAKDDLIRMGISEKNITVVPHGVILNLPKPLPPKEKVKTIVFLGALAKDKGVEDAIKAISVLKSEIQNNYKFQFWIVGKGSPAYVKYLKKLINQNKIEPETKMFGFVDSRKKFELLAKAHVLINPSAREGWGLVNIEANAVSTPVVAYSSAGLIDSVKNNESGILCEKNSPEEMAINVKKILDNQELYERLQKGSVRWSNNFSWINSVAKSLDLIKEVTT